jgi:hypothetical protein
VKEDIDVGWICPQIPNLQYDNALFNRQNKCITTLVDVMDCHVQALCVKLGRIKEAFKLTSNVPIASVLIDNNTTTCASKLLTFF